MPYKAPTLRSCGCITPTGVLCEHAKQRRAEIDQRRIPSRQRGYDTRWGKARASWLRTHPTCAMVIDGKPCGQPADTVDHVIPHRGDQRLFWDRSNWMSLCQHHHNSTKQAMERRALRGEVKTSGKGIWTAQGQQLSKNFNSAISSTKTRG